MHTASTADGSWVGGLFTGGLQRMMKLFEKPMAKQLEAKEKGPCPTPASGPFPQLPPLLDGLHVCDTRQQIVTSHPILDVSKPTEFWIRNDEDQEVEVELRLLPYDNDDEGMSYFTILPPCERYFRKSTTQNPLNTFKISYTPPKQTERNALVEVRFLRNNQTVQVSQFRVYGNVKWELKMSEIKKAAELKHVYFPLHNILDRWHLAVESLVNPPAGAYAGDHIEAVNGLHSALSALKDIYLMDIPGWGEVRDKVEVGMIKETQDRGNTSVSMGLATRFFADNPARNFVAFVNCGTGGTKYQLYSRLKPGSNQDVEEPNRNLCVMVAEFKPGNGSVSQISVGDYRPRKFHRRQLPEEVRAELARGLKHAPWVLDLIQAEFPAEFQAELQSKEFVPFAFVTGSIRDHWATSSDEMKSIMNNELKVLFPGCEMVSSLVSAQSQSAKSESCFLTQYEEGRFEFLAISAMYKAINPTTKSSIAVSIGIGNTSSQLTCLQQVRKGAQTETQAVVLPYSYGLRSPKLRNFGRHVVSNLEIMKDLVAIIKELLNKGHKPVIALKSGALFHLWGEEELREKLCSPIITEDAITNENLWNPVIGPCSVPRLCIAEQLKTGATQDYVLVYVNGNRAPEQLELMPNDTLHFEHFPEYIWWWPGKCKQVKAEETKKSGMSEGTNTDAQLLIHIPFDLLKDFLERRGETIQLQFKHLLLDFFDPEKSPKSFECIAKVYRLLHDIYTMKQEDLKYDFYDIAAAFTNLVLDYDEALRDAFRKLPKDLKNMSRKENEERKWLKILNKSTTVLQDEEAKDFNVLRRRAVVHYTELARKLDAIAERLNLEFTNLYTKHDVKSVDSIKRKLGLRKGDFTCRHILDYLRGTIFVGTPKDRGAETATLLDEVSMILDAIESSVGPICRIKLDGCKKKLFFIVNVRFENLVVEVQIRLHSLKKHSDDHLRWEVERTFGECVSGSMDLDAACLDFFSAPCGFNFQRFDETQQVTLRCVDGKLDVLQNEIPRYSETKKLTFSHMQCQELGRYSVFLRGTQDTTPDYHSGDGVDDVRAPEYIRVGTNESVNFIKGVQVGFGIVWKAIRLRRDFASQASSSCVNENKVAAFLGNELCVARANSLWNIEEEGEAAHAYYRMESPTVAELARLVAKSSSAFLQGIMMACRFCKKNRIGKMLKDEAFLETFAYLKQEATPPELKDKVLLIGVLASLCAVADIAHEAWLVDHKGLSACRARQVLHGPALVRILGLEEGTGSPQKC